MPADDLVTQREYDSFKTAVHDRISDLQNLVSSHFAEDALAFQEIKANVKEVDANVRKLNDSTIAVASSQGRIELKIESVERERKEDVEHREKERKESIVTLEKNRNKILAIAAIVVTLTSPLIAEVVHRIFEAISR